LKRQVSHEAKRKEIIDFLCAESGSHDYTINRREARELGLSIENPSDDLYSLLRKVHLSYVEELSLLDPYDPHSLLGQSQTIDYVFPRAVIESCKTGCHRFLSEGTLTRTMIQQMGPTGPIQQVAINDNRRFEGWRKK